MYKKRLLHDTISEFLGIFQALSLVGPKYCGKTTLARQFSKSELLITPGTKESLKVMLQHKLENMLGGPYPRLIDEWQLIPEIWDEVRHWVDRTSDRGLFILTGSSAANLSEHAHSGQGRIHPVKVRPMSLFESGVSAGLVSLQDLFDGQPFKPHTSSITVDDYALWIIKGGWPLGLTDAERAAIFRMRSYLQSLCDDDVNRVTGKKYNSMRVRKTLESLARFVGSEAPNTSILKDLDTDDSGMSPNTLIDYLDVLKKLYITEDLYSWNPNLRSSVTIRSAPSRFFVDPSIGAAALNMTSAKLLNDFETFGLYFENLAIRDIRVYAESIHAEVFRYKDSKNNEIDIIVKLFDGRWGAIEVKMGSDRFDETAKKLIKFAENIDQKKEGPPAFLAIVTATKLAYKRDDGVMIIPLGILKN